MKYFKLASLPLLALCLTACGTSEERSQVKFQVGSGDWETCDKSDSQIACWGSATGHEVLTRMAAKYANTVLVMNVDLMEKLYPEMEDFEEELTVSGLETKDPIVRGNYTTDHPELVDNFGKALVKWQEQDFGIPAEEEWHDGPNRQKFHSLRDFKVIDTSTKQVKTVSNMDACLDVQRVINSASARGLARWKGEAAGFPVLTSGVISETEGDYFIGTATHTIQDSFSTVHVQRDFGGIDGRNGMKAFCVYNKNVPGVCKHSTLDAVFEDSVWDWNLLAEKGETRLKDEAYIAMKTTGLYLLHMYRAGMLKKDLKAELVDFYTGSIDLRKDWGVNGKLVGFDKTGTFSCDRLND